MINDLRLLLLAEATIAAIVGTNVFVSRAGTGSTLPQIVIEQMGSDEGNDLGTTGDFRGINYDIDCNGGTAQDAFTLAAAVRTFLQDFTGTAGTQTIRAVVLNDERNKVLKSASGTAVAQFQVTLDVDVLYRPV